MIFIFSIVQVYFLLLIEFHYTFSISYILLTCNVYYCTTTSDSGWILDVFPAGINEKNESRVGDGKGEGLCDVAICRSSNT